MPAKLIAVQYGRYDYGGVQPRLTEVPAHFDIRSISPSMDYSLHTEYSFGRRRYSNPVFEELGILRTASWNGIPLLWHCEAWSRQFFRFVAHLVGANPPPEVIEIHPPFRSYCADIDTFLERYSDFEALVQEAYPGSLIALENRTGSCYTGSDFLVSSASDIASLLHAVGRRGYALRLMLDIPQLLTALGKEASLDIRRLKDAFLEFEADKEAIAGIHIWGCDGRAHTGRLDSLFGFRAELKGQFLGFVSEYFDDGICRLLVPEVNSSPQTVFDSVLGDLLQYFEFV